MATTTKTLTPTNQTITLPDMTERPNASVLVDGIGKDADAINALSEQIAKSSLAFNGVYPNGKNYNQTYFRVTIPCWNPQKKAITVTSAYVYDSSGGFIEITNAVTVTTIEKCGFMCEITFSSSHAGKMLTIGYSIAN